MKRSLRYEMRRAFGPRLWITTLALSLAMLLTGVSKVENSAFRDGLDLFGQLMISVFAPALPLVVMLLGGIPLHAALRNRFASQMRTRLSPREYLGAQLLAGGSAVFLGLALSTAALGIFGFYIWGALRPELLQPEVYGLTAEELVADATTRVSLSQVIGGGVPVYIGAYSVWVAFNAALLYLLGAFCMITFSPAWLGFVIPFAVFVGESVLAALAGHPHYGLLFAIFPFGLTQASIDVTLTPTLTLGLLLSAWAVPLFVQAPRLGSLA